jgi:hypothetical protein
MLHKGNRYWMHQTLTCLPIRSPSVFECRSQLVCQVVGLFPILLGSALCLRMISLSACALYATRRLDLDLLLSDCWVYPQVHILCCSPSQSGESCVQYCSALHLVHCIVEAMQQSFVWSACFFLCALLIPQYSFAVTVEQLGTPLMSCSAITRPESKRLTINRHPDKSETPLWRGETNTLRLNRPN